MKNIHRKIAYLVVEKGECGKDALLLKDSGYDVKIFDSLAALQVSIRANLISSDVQNESNLDCQKFINCFATLTNREKEVVKYLVLGDGVSSNKEIAKQMNISHRTVEEYRASAMRKMTAKSLKELITKVINCNLFRSKDV